MAFIMTFLLMEQLFSIKLVNFLNLLYGNIFFVSFINKLFNKFSRVIGCLGMLSIFVEIEVPGCMDYFSLMSTDVPISH